MPITFEQSLQLEFNTYLTHSERVGVILLRHMKGSSDVNIKKVNVEVITVVFLERVLERRCMHSKHTVLQCLRLQSWISVLWLELCHWDYYRSTEFPSPQNPA